MQLSFSDFKVLEWTRLQQNRRFSSVGFFSSTLLLFVGFSSWITLIIHEFCLSHKNKAHHRLNVLYLRRRLVSVELWTEQNRLLHSAALSHQSRTGPLLVESLCWKTVREEKTGRDRLLRRTVTSDQRYPTTLDQNHNKLCVFEVLFAFPLWSITAPCQNVMINTGSLMWPSESLRLH